MNKDIRALYIILTTTKHKIEKIGYNKLYFYATPNARFEITVTTDPELKMRIK